MPLLSEKRPYHVTRQDDLRRQALNTLQDLEVLMRDGHFDYGNGFHGRALPQSPSVVPAPVNHLAARAGSARRHPGASSSRETDFVAGPATGGALLAHTLAGLLDGRRALTHPPCSFAPFTNAGGRLRAAKLLRSPHGRPARALADDVRNTGKTLQLCAELVNGRWRSSDRHSGNLRPHGGDRRSRRAELCARGLPGTAEFRGCGLPHVPGRRTDHHVLNSRCRTSSRRRFCQRSDAIVRRLSSVPFRLSPGLEDNTCRVQRLRQPRRAGPA